MFKKIIALLLTAIIASLTFAGCNSGSGSVSTSAAESQTADGNNADSNNADKLKIVCTLFPQYDFVRQIVGDKADVSLLLTPGVESHSYEPTPADMIKVTNSDLFVFIGKNMETWASSIVKTIKSDKTVILELAASMGLTLEIHDDDADHHDSDEPKSNNEDVDPHIWTDPIIAVGMVDSLCKAICELDTKNADYYRTNADNYKLKIVNLDLSIKSIVREGNLDKIYFADEFALENFVDEYDLEHMAAFDSCGDHAEASASKIAGIISEMKANKSPVIFYSELTDSKEAKLISKETGAKMLLFHSCHNLSATDFANGETYVSLMQKNAENLKVALTVQ